MWYFGADVVEVEDVVSARFDEGFLVDQEIVFLHRSTN